MSHWLQLRLEVPGARLDAVEAACLAAGALSVTVEDAADDPVYEPLPGEVRTWPHNRVSALFPAGHDPEPLRAELAGLLGGEVPGWRVEALADRDWERAWLDDFRPMRFGHRLWVCPGDRDPPDPGAVNLRLDPGLAFGTGTHPTTALCLEWLEGHPAPATLLDYGCGSGILAIAGRLLGAREAWAVDLDPQALRATRDNAERNGIVAGLHACLPEALPALRCDLVVANILAGPLVGLAAELTARLRPGG
ncbi:MAG: 50S ribosomal protein L11 methyltransferase, partial [Gammaproteobacteria bacterium]|nr:50S ribosomal protein L11 methyltransferase [Gammaproteobacteria bacterium]